MKKRIALLAGGYTGESVISLKSAQTVLNHVDQNKYELYLIIVDTEGWWYKAEDGKKYAIDKNDFSLSISNDKISFDAAFIIIHGTPGEDGKLQGYFDMIGLPYNTCDATCSAITMNKAYTKSIIDGLENVCIAKSVQLFKSQAFETSDILKKLSLPLFVKPNSGGSSIGMSKVNEANELQAALDKAFEEDEQIIVEEFIAGREFTMGVVRMNNKVITLPSTEIISSKDFFDYEAKYTTGVSEEITPGRMTEEEKNRVEKAMLSIYKLLNCNGVVRIDYILQEGTAKMFVLEVNTVPGQSENSIVPQQVRAMGMTLQEFYGAMLEETLNKHTN